MSPLLLPLLSFPARRWACLLPMRSTPPAAVHAGAASDDTIELDTTNLVTTVRPTLNTRRQRWCLGAGAVTAVATVALWGTLGWFFIGMTLGVGLGRWLMPDETEHHSPDLLADEAPATGWTL